MPEWRHKGFDPKKNPDKRFLLILYNRYQRVFWLVFKMAALAYSEKLKNGKMIIYLYMFSNIFGGQGI